MRVLFLDIDGVLNGHEWCAEAESNMIRPSCVAELNRIVRAVPRLGVVLSSAWRYMVLQKALDLVGFTYLLRTHGVSKDLSLVGYTVADEVEPSRGRQIQRWRREMEDVFDIESYVILDDVPEGLDFWPVGNRLVKTDGKVGLTWKEADRVIHLLLEG